MPLRYRFKSSLHKAFDSLGTKDQELAIKALEALKTYFTTSRSSYGLRVTKLHENKSGKTFEARISLALRIVWVEIKDEVIFSLIGNHDEVRRFIKNI